MTHHELWPFWRSLGPLLVALSRSSTSSPQNSSRYYNSSHGTDYVAVSSFRDLLSKSPKHKSAESPDFLVILALSPVDFRLSEPTRVQHFWMLCLLGAFQMWVTSNKFPAIFRAFLPYLHLCITCWVLSKDLFNICDSFYEIVQVLCKLWYKCDDTVVHTLWR